MPLQDIFTEQNTQLQTWALRSQACLPLTLADQMDSAYAATSPLQSPCTPGTDDVLLSCESDFHRRPHIRSCWSSPHVGDAS